MRGTDGDAGDGFYRACRMSWMPQRIRSFDKVAGMMGSLVGSHVRVSQMRMVRDAHIHTV